MSEDQQQQPKAITAAAPQPAVQSRWTPQAVIGLLCLVAATVVRRLVNEPDLADGLMLLGGSLLGWAAPLPPVKPGGHGPGGSGTGLIVGVVLGALAMLAPGCGAAQVRAEESVQFQRRPGPTCYVRTVVDGEIVQELEAPFTCVPPPEFCAPGLGELGYESPPGEGPGEVTP